MDIPAPAELAKPLGLSMGNSVVRSKANPDNLLPYCLVYNRVAKLPRELERAFYVQFNALHLPSFVSAVLFNMNGSDGSEMSGHWRTALIATLHQAMEDPGRSPTFARFVRLHPEQAIDLYAALTSALSLTPASSDDILLMPLLFPLRTLILSIEIYTPNTTLPSLDPSTRSNFRALLPRLKRLITTPNKTPQEKIGHDSIYALLTELGRGDLDLPALVESQMQWKAESPWLACETRAVMMPGLVHCVHFEEGEEMLACSRCLAVRYCSREHQKADWKRHKLTCFEPTW